MTAVESDSAPAASEPPPPPSSASSGVRSRVNSARLSRSSTRRLKGRRRDFTRGSLWTHIALFGSPLVVAMGFMAVFNLVDVFIVGRLPNAHEAVTIVSICDTLVTLFVVLITGIGNAAMALIARAVGKHNLLDARNAATQSLLITAVISAVVFLLGAIIPRMTLKGIGVDPGSELFAVGVDYLRVALMGGFTMLFVVQLTSILRGIGNSTWPTVVLVVVNVLNIILAVVFVLGPDTGIPFGLDWGVIGAAWAALTARLIGFGMCVLIFLFGIGRHYVHFNPRRWRPRRDTVRSLLKIGLPSSGQLIVRVLAILGLIMLIFHLLTDAANQSIGTAFALAVKLDLVALFMIIGWGQAAATIVGQNLGAGHKARAIRAGWIASWYAMMMSAAVGAFFFLWAPAIIDFFFETETDPPAEIAEEREEEAGEEARRAWQELQQRIYIPERAVRLTGADLDWGRADQAEEALQELHAFWRDERYTGTQAAGEAWRLYKDTEHRLVVYHGSWYLRIIVLAWPLMAIGIVLSQAMTGAGQTRIPVILDASVLIGLMLPAVWAVNEFTPWAQRMTWVVIALAYAVLAVLYVVSFRRGKWTETLAVSYDAGNAEPKTTDQNRSEAREPGKSNETESENDVRS